MMRMQVLEVLTVASCLIHLGRSQETSEHYKTSAPHTTKDIPRGNLELKLGVAIYLAERESHLYETMKEFKVLLEQQLNHVSKWLADYEDSSLKLRSQAGGHVEEQERILQTVTDHPIAVLRMIERFAKFDKELLLQNAPQKSLKITLRNIASQSHFPDNSDYNGAMENVYTLIDIYKLSLEDLLRGKVADVQTQVKLTLEQAYGMAALAENKGDYNYAYVWLQALKQEAMAAISRPDRESFLHAIEAGITRVNIAIGNFRGKAGNPEVPLTLKIRKLCNGETMLTDKQKSKLFCFYENSIYARWRINPLKVEVHSWSPYVVQFYDAITERSLRYLENKIRMERIEHAQMINPKYNTNDSNTNFWVVNRGRFVTKLFLTREGRDKEFLKLENRITDIIRLETNDQRIAPEFALVAAAAAAGGRSVPHTDTVRLPESWKYTTDKLDDVPRGGATAFLGTGISVKPLKNSGVLWYNLLRNGRKDKRSLHFPCPVLLGLTKIASFRFCKFPKEKLLARVQMNKIQP